MRFRTPIFAALVMSLFSASFADRVPVAVPAPGPTPKSVFLKVEEEKQAVTFLYLVDDKGFQRVGIAIHALSFTNKLALNVITGYDLKTDESWTAGTTLSFRVLQWDGGGVFLHAGLATVNLLTNDPLILKPIYGVGIGATWR